MVSDHNSSPRAKPRAFGSGELKTSTVHILICAIKHCLKPESQMTKNLAFIMLIEKSVVNKTKGYFYYMICGYIQTLSELQFVLQMTTPSEYCFVQLIRLNPSLAEHDKPCLSKQCRSRSVGFCRSQLIWICTVIKYVNFYQKPEASNLIGWKLEVGMVP